MEKEKRHFKKLTIGILIIVVYSIIMFSFGKMLSNREDNSYPEEIYQYLEETADKTVKNGAFYPTLLPKDVEPSFTRNGDLELCYKSLDTMYMIKITVQVSDNFEIKSKTRNFTQDEYSKKINSMIFGITSICGLGLLAIIIVVKNTICDFKKAKDKNK